MNLVGFGIVHLGFSVTKIHAKNLHDAVIEQTNQNGSPPTPYNGAVHGGLVILQKSAEAIIQAVSQKIIKDDRGQDIERNSVSRQLKMLSVDFYNYYLATNELLKDKDDTYIKLLNFPSGKEGNISLMKMTAEILEISKKFLLYSIDFYDSRNENLFLLGHALDKNSHLAILPKEIIAQILTIDNQDYRESFAN